jgi:hypothetical protein
MHRDADAPHKHDTAIAHRQQFQQQIGYGTAQAQYQPAAQELHHAAQQQQAQARAKAQFQAQLQQAQYQAAVRDQQP